PVDWVSPDGKTFIQLGRISSDTDAVTAQTAFAAAAYAYVAMRYRAEKVSEAPLIVIEDDGQGNEEWLPDHPLARLLEEPSPDFDMGELLYLTRIYRDMTGGALWVLNRDLGGDAAMVSVFRHDEFTVEPATVDGRPRLFGRFRVAARTGERVFEPGDVVYFREPNPYSWSRGLAPLDVALGMLNLGLQATATVKDILRNALFPTVVIQADPQWSPTDEELTAQQARLEEYAKRAKKGAPLMLLGGGRSNVVSQDLTGLMPDEVLDRVEATIAAVFGVPPVVLSYLVGLKNSPWSQMEQARQQAYDDTIIPLWRRDERTLTRQLLRPVDPEPRRLIRFDLTGVRALQTDRVTMSQVAERTRDIATVNERRALLGWDPIDGPEGERITGLAPAVQAPAGAEGDEARAAPTPDETKALTKEQRHRVWWLMFDVAAKAQEPLWMGAVGEQLERDRAAIAELARRHLREAKQTGPAVDPTDFLRALGAYLSGPARRQWEAVVEPLVRATGEAGVRRLSLELGISWDVLQPGLLDYTQREAAWLITQVTDTTKQAVRDALEAALAAGENLQALARRIEAVDAAFGPARAELIARTETTRVTNGAQQESLERWAADERVRVTKTWIAVRDSRTRPEHRELHGTTVDIDAEFPNGLKAPGEPNCRCTLAYDVEG
ncbi:MAG TPA: phage portal protein, partial [Longimicrobiales bacterium]